jgi:putative endonuclease
MSGALAWHSGYAAEEIVARDYARRGHRTADRRWRGTGGEIDLIAEDGAGLIFIEVKKARTHAEAAERLSRRQIDRIHASAAEYLGRMPRGQLTDCRFDVALVDAGGRVEIIENATPC